VIKKKVVTTEILEDVVNKTSADKIAIGDLISAMDSGGFGLVMTISIGSVFLGLYGVGRSSSSRAEADGP
jgi:hypothetical protein